MQKMHLTIRNLDAVIRLSYNDVIERTQTGFHKMEAFKRNRKDDFAGSQKERKRWE